MLTPENYVSARMSDSQRTIDWLDKASDGTSLLDDEYLFDNRDNVDGKFFLWGLGLEQLSEIARVFEVQRSFLSGNKIQLNLYQSSQSDRFFEFTSNGGKEYLTSFLERQGFSGFEFWDGSFTDRWRK